MTTNGYTNILPDDMKPGCPDCERVICIYKNCPLMMANKENCEYRRFKK